MDVKKITSYTSIANSKTVRKFIKNPIKKIFPKLKSLYNDVFEFEFSINVNKFRFERPKFNRINF